MTDKPASYAAFGRECRIIRNVGVVMRDGTRLATTVYLPLDERPCPAVLVRTAYNRTIYYDPFFPAHGMGFVVQDCRGRYESEGEHAPFVREAEDGYDTLEWLGRQPWCNGKVGMYGDSYLAATQFFVAPLGSPYLRALNPRFMAGDCWKRAYYCDGAFSLALTWSWLCFECASRVSHASGMPLFDVPALLRTLPLLTLDERSGAGAAQHYRDYVSHNTYDAHWQTLRIREDLGKYSMPVLLTGGWYDNYAAETTANFTALRQQARTPQLRDSHRMIIGPWTHGINPRTVLGEIDFGPEAQREDGATQRWLDCILHGRAPQEFQAAPIHLFVMGRNAWRDEYEWPLARARATRYYLRAGGQLSATPPSGAEPPDGYTYDPADPVPTRGGNHSVGPYNPGLYDFVKPGPYDQRPIEARRDVLTYTTGPMEVDTEVTGPLLFRLFAASSARDTDFVVKLTDVYPDGRSINITEGVIRARFREGVWGPPKLMRPGDIYAFDIDMQVTSNVFMQGHRIRVSLTSSNFPIWDRNLNTGDDPATDTQMLMAQQTIYHDAEHASHIVLPVIPAA
jgi:uncharacterized protein